MAELRIKECVISGVYEIAPFYAEDNRGIAVKEYDKVALEKRGIEFTPCESMIIESKKGVLRGVHFQIGDTQDKIVRCIKGKVWTVILDLRKNSKTLGEWITVNINNGTEVYIPGGCALGTLAIEDSMILCMFGESYDGSRDSGIKWDDETLAIEWPLELIDCKVIVSNKDQSLRSFKEYIMTVVGK